MTMPKNDSQGTQADKPPWEQPGAFRLDYEPHRGNLLGWTARTGIVLAALSCCLAGLPLLVALPLSLGTCLSARRDLALMRKGLMDPEGRDLTREALITGLIACGLCCEVGALSSWGLLPALVKVLR